MTSTTTVAVHVTTKNDTYGNPRRGWIVRTITAGNDYADGTPDFVEEGYQGRFALDTAYPGAIVVAHVNVSPGEYRDRVRAARQEVAR